MRERVRVECAWLLALARGPASASLAALPQAARGWLESLAADPAATDVAAIKAIEIAHQSRRQGGGILDPQRAARPAARARRSSNGCTSRCTSEDINNLAYALMLKSARSTRAAAGAAGDRCAARFARRAARVGRHVGANARPGGLAHHGRKGNRQCGRAPAQPAIRSRARRHPGQDERRGGQFQRARRRSAAHRLAAVQRALRRIARLAAEQPHHANRAARLDRRILPCARCAPTRCSSIWRATCGAISPSATSGKGRSPAKSAPPPCRTRSIPSTSRMPKAIWDWPMRCSRTSRTSCRSRGCSATSATRPCCAISASPSAMPRSPISR